jgi:spermidine/putrescine transport system permease protein
MAEHASLAGRDEEPPASQASGVVARRRRRRRLLPRWYMAWPALLWWAFFFVVPLAWIAYYSLGVKPADLSQGAVSLDHLSFTNYVTAASDIFLKIFWITVRTGGLGTLACALVGFPVAYALANHVSPRWRAILLFLLVLPYWTSFLLRTFAWRIVLAPEGTLSGALQALGFLDRPLGILDTNAAVQLGIIYNYLPLMILPMFVALDRIDPALPKASMDLGAGPIATFFSVTVPLAMPGILGGLLMTFILATGDYVVPAILGGARGLMVGNLVATQILASQNLPLGAAMAIMLIAMLAAVVVAAGLTLAGLRGAFRLIRGPAI